MDILKSLFGAPQGLPAADMAAGDIEIVLEPEDGVEVEVEVEESIPFDANLAEHMEDKDLHSLASDLLAEVDADVASRKDWADSYVRGLEVLGFKYEERTEPWEGACGVFSPLMAEAAIRFQAETMSETFPAAGPVRTKIIGEETRDKIEAAQRVKADMNYELTEVMVEYRPEHERMLFNLGLGGSAFKKVYFDPSLGRQVSLYIPAEDVIVPYGASNIETAERVTHVLRKTKNEMLRLQDSGFYRDVSLGEPASFFSDIEERKAKESGYSLTSDDRYALYEVHAELVLEGVDDEDELPKPYVITIDKGTSTVLSIRRNWVEGDPLTLKRQHFVHYVYVPGFGFYGFGLIHIIGGYAKAGTMLVRQLVDSGTLANLPGGLKARGLRIKGDDTPIGPGEFRDVDVMSGSIRDNIMPLPYKEPSQTLLALLNRIVEEGRRLGAISEMNVSDMSANAPVGTTLALLEQTLKPMAAVQARVHYAMKQEFKLLKKLIAEHAPQDYGYVPDRAEPRARQADYATVEVIPVSDPNSSTMAQRVVQYQTAMQMSQGAPQIYDLQMLHRQMLEVIGIKNADKIVPMAEDVTPTDPVSENMAFLTGKPVKAFLYQDHEAHMATHGAFMQDPQIAQMIGQNPMGQTVMAAMQAHMAEHMAFAYRKQIEDKLGVSLPDPGMAMPEELEVQLSRLLADAGRQVTQQKQQQAAQQAAQQAQQDPVMQLQMQELQLKGAELQRKQQKDQIDAALGSEKLKLEQQRLMQQGAIEAARLDAQKDQADKKSDLDAAKTLLDMATKGAQPPPGPRFP